MARGPYSFHLPSPALDLICNLLKNRPEGVCELRFSHALLNLFTSNGCARRPLPSLPPKERELVFCAGRLTRKLFTRAAANGGLCGYKCILHSSRHRAWVWMRKPASFRTMSCRLNSKLLTRWLCARGVKLSLFAQTATATPQQATFLPGVLLR